MTSIENLAAALREAGLTRGEIVATIMKPTASLVVATLGIFGARLVWAPLDGDTPPAWRQGQLENMGARLQLVEEARCTQFHAENPEVPIWCLDLKGKIV